MSKVNARILNKILTTDVDFTLPPNEDLETFEGWSETDLAVGEIGLNTFRGIAYVNYGEEILPLVGEQEYIGKELMQTGQSTSYFTGDEGDTPHGRLVDFFTLNGNNVFGNTNRFTDELGGQTYTNNIMLDHSTFENDVCLGVYRVIFATDTLVNQIAACQALTVGSYTTGWRLWNAVEANNLVCLEVGQILNYTQLSLGAGTIGYIYTSNTYSALSCQKAYANASTFYLQPDTVANNSKAVAVRSFTWNGTAFI